MLVAKIRGPQLAAEGKERQGERTDLFPKTEKGSAHAHVQLAKKARKPKRKSSCHVGASTNARNFGPLSWTRSESQPLSVRVSRAAAALSPDCSHEHSQPPKRPYDTPCDTALSFWW